MRFFQQLLLYTGYILASISIITTVLPFSKIDYWFIRVFDYPRFQIGFVALVALVIILAFPPLKPTLRYGLIVAMLLVIGYQLSQIFPYTQLSKKQVKTAVDQNSDLRLLVANVYMDNRNAEGLLKIISDAEPDVVLLLETNYWWQEAIRELEEAFPHTIQYPLENTYGMLLYSKFPLKHDEINFIIDEEIPSFHTFVELKNGKSVELYCLHPTPPVPGENDASTERDAELLVVAKNVRDKSNPIIVAGDMNDVAWSYTTRMFQKISQLLDPRVGRGLFNSFHAGHFLLRWPLDHIFHSKHFRVISLQRLEKFGSDHFPIFINLSYAPEEGNGDSLEEPDQEEMKEADETIKEAKSQN